MIYFTISQFYILLFLERYHILSKCSSNSSYASPSHSLLQVGLVHLLQTMKALNFVIGPLIVGDVVRLIICNVMRLSVD